jgi:hypothetical protein
MRAPSERNLRFWEDVFSRSRAASMPINTTSMCSMGVREVLSSTTSIFTSSPGWTKLGTLRLT